VTDLETRVRAHLQARLAAVEVAPGSPDVVRSAPGRRWLVPTAAAASLALVAAAGLGAWLVQDDGGTGGAGDAMVVGEQPETTTAAPTTAATEAPVVATTGVPDGDTSPAGETSTPPVVVGVEDPLSRQVPVGHGDGFVAVGNWSDGTVRLRTSSDGTTWAETPVDLGGGTVQRLTSDGETLLAAGYLSDGAPWVGVSRDGGATWRGRPLPTPDDVWPLNVHAVGTVGGRGMLVIGSRPHSPGGPASTFAWWSSDGEVWELEVEPLGPAVNVDDVVVGPHGLVAVTSTVASPPVLQFSADGDQWEPITLPVELAGGIPAVGAGPGGYVVVAQGGVVLHSSDGRAWTLVGDLHDEQRSMAYGFDVVGGGAGFVVAFVENVQNDEPIVIERDGRRLTADPGNDLTTIVDVATGDELLRYEGDVSTPPTEVLRTEGDHLTYFDPATGEAVFSFTLAEMTAAMNARPGGGSTPVGHVFTSLDGTGWQEVSLPDGTQAAQLAVSATAILATPADPGW
jgi:hypothetical protein